MGAGQGRLERQGQLRPRRSSCGEKSALSLRARSFLGRNRGREPHAGAGRDDTHGGCQMAPCPIQPSPRSTDHVTTENFLLAAKVFG